MYLLEEDLKFPKDSFKSMKYQPYEMKPSFSMVRVYQWWNYWYGEVYISFSGGLDSTVLAYIVCQAYRKYKLTGKIPLVFADTGTEFPEIREFVKTYTEYQVGVYVPDGMNYRGEWYDLKAIKKAKRKDRSRPVSEMLLMMFRSAARDRKKVSSDGEK